MRRLLAALGIKGTRAVSAHAFALQMTMAALEGHLGKRNQLITEYDIEERECNEEGQVMLQVTGQLFAGRKFTCTCVFGWEPDPQRFKPEAIELWFPQETGRHYLSLCTIIDDERGQRLVAPGEAIHGPGD